MVSLREKDGVGGVGGGLSPAGAAAGVALSLSGSVAGEIIYPKAVEAFLSTTDRPPCCQSAGGGIFTAPAAETAETNSTVESNGSASNRSSAAAGLPPISCRCYEGTTGKLSGRRHDPREALEALRPASRSPPQQLHLTGANPGKSGRSHGGGQDASAGPGFSGRGGVDDVEGGSEEEPPTMPEVAVDPLGAVLLLCEVLRGEERVSAVEAVGPTLRRECCGWVLDHLAALFPGWVDAASSASAAGGAVDAATDVWASGQGVASALCDEVATALGLFACRRALNGEFREAQARLGARGVLAWLQQVTDRRHVIRTALAWSLGATGTNGRKGFAFHVGMGIFVFKRQSQDWVSA